MCGLSGTAGHIYAAEKKANEELMILNIVRGPHSTGLAGVPRDDKKSPLLLKALGTPFGGEDADYPGIFAFKKYNTIMQEHVKCLINHNRFATKGAISARNAHPFSFSKLVGAHNGTLYPSSINKLIGDYETDSEALFNNLNEEGIESTAPKLDGAWALTWYDLPTKTINFLRNDQRTLYFAFTADKKTLFWSSDPHPLYYVFSRHKLKMENDKVNLLPTDTWFSFKIPDSTNQFGEPERKKVEGHKWSNSSYTNWGKRGKSFQEGLFEDDVLDDPFFCGVTFNKREPEDKKSEASSNSDLVDHVNYSAKVTDKAKVIPPSSSNNNTNLIPFVSKNTPSSPHKDNLVRKIHEEREALFKIQFPNVVKDSWILKMEEMNHRVFFCKKTCVWIMFYYQVTLRTWARSEHENAPLCVPLKRFDPEKGGSHQFRYEGRKNKRKIYYKGFQGRTLNKEHFEDIMGDGCVKCQRKPIWGNIVRFFSDRIFLCEHCEMNPNNIKLLTKE